MRSATVGTAKETAVTTWALALARARARAGVLLAIAATIAVMVLGLSAVIGAIGSAVRAAVVAAVEAAPEPDRSAVLTIPAGADTAAQAAAADALFGRLFGDSLDVEALSSTDGGSLRWQLTVAPDGLDPWGVPTLADDLRRLDVEARAVDGLAPQGASVDGGLAATLAVSADGVRAVQAVVPVPLALIAIGGVIATLQLARLLGDARGGEAALLRARGLGPAVARRGAVAELLIVALLGALGGWLLSAGLVSLLGSGFLAALRTTWIVPAAAALAVGPMAGLSAHRAADAPATERAGRSRAAATGLSAVLVVLAAGVFVWQLRGLAERTAGAIDVWALVVTAIAPALALAAASVLVLAAFGPVAHLAATIAAARPGMSPALPARMVARHVAAFGVVVALIALASGGAVVAGASVATWAVVAEQSATLRAGADARAVLGAERVSAADVQAVAERTEAAAILSHAATVSDVPVSVVAIPDGAAASVISPLPAAAIAPADIAAQLAHGPVGVALGPAADRLTATFAVRGNLVRSIVETADGGFLLTPEGEVVTQEALTLPAVDLLEGEAWLVDDLGTPTRLALAIEIAPDAAVAGEGELTAAAVLPDGRAPWTLVGLTIGFRNSAGSLSPSLTPIALTTGAGGDLAWPSTAPIVLGDDRGVAILSFAPVPDSVPAVVSRSLADAFGMGLGDSFDVKLDRTSRIIRFEVRGFAAAVPGADRDAALLLPLGAVTQRLFSGSGSGLRADQVWASGADAEAALTAAFGADAVDAGAANTALTGSLAATWWVATSVGGLLAAVAVVAAAAALARRRAADAFVLRAVGVTAASQARGRVGELVAVTGSAALVGGVLGGVVAWLTLPALTVAAVPGAPAVLADTIVWGWAPPALLVVLVAASVGVAAVVVSRLIALHSRAGRVREAT